MVYLYQVKEHKTNFGGNTYGTRKIVKDHDTIEKSRGTTRK